jgi:hypothetical protein
MKKIFIIVIALFLVQKNVNGVSINDTKKILKDELNHVLGLDSVNPDKRIFVTTITRVYNKGGTGAPTPLISHSGLKQLLILLRALCEGGKISGYNNLGIKLNDAPDAQASTHEEHQVEILRTELSTFYSTNSENIKNSPNIIIFNEMFFSKSDPLEFFPKMFILDRIKEISAKAPNVIFCPNFLYIEHGALDNTAKLRAISNMKTKMTGSNKHASASYAVSTLINVAQPVDFPNCYHLINRSYYLNNDKILTQYQKATYFKEADPLIIGKSVLYDFGSGLDMKVSDGNLTNALLKNISTEICFDLDCKIRETNGWKNTGSGQSNLHIIQSNTIDPQMNEVPTDRYIAHSDPKLNSNLNDAVVFYVASCMVPYCGGLVLL